VQRVRGAMIVMTDVLAGASEAEGEVRRTRVRSLDAAVHALDEQLARRDRAGRDEAALADADGRDDEEIVAAAVRELR